MKSQRIHFRQTVFKRDGGRCVFCGSSAQDAHHLLERRLWKNGGYRPNNGVSLCGECHIKAERTLVHPKELRKAAGITQRILPKHLYSDYEYDKWGNILWSDGKRIRGELFYDPSVQKILPKSVLDKFIPYVKYPRTLHVPWTGSKTKDDRTHTDMRFFRGREVVVTEKRDGENATVYWDGYFHARSISGNMHPSQDWIKNYIQEWYWELPEMWRVCGENLYATHNLKYENLDTYFEAFSIWDEKNRCLSWNQTEEWAALLGIKMVPVLYRGPYDERALKDLSIDEDRQEGYVIRVADRFPFSEYKRAMAKYVREGHVQQTVHNWKRCWNPEKINKLSTEKNNHD